MKKTKHNTVCLHLCLKLYSVFDYADDILIGQNIWFSCYLGRYLPFKF